MKWAKKTGAWLAAEYVKDYRESKARIFDTIIKNSLHLNTIILTVSIATLTAVAALNDRVFTSHPYLSIAVLGLFIVVILLSTINFFLSGLALRDLQKKFNEDILLPFKMKKYTPRYQRPQKVLNALVLSGFCLGLILFMVLLGVYVTSLEAATDGRVGL